MPRRPDPRLRHPRRPVALAAANATANATYSALDCKTPVALALPREQIDREVVFPPYGARKHLTSGGRAGRVRDVENLSEAVVVLDVLESDLRVYGSYIALDGKRLASVTVTVEKYCETFRPCMKSKFVLGFTLESTATDASDALLYGVLLAKRGLEGKGRQKPLTAPSENDNRYDVSCKCSSGLKPAPDLPSTSIRLGNGNEIFETKREKEIG